MKSERERKPMTENTKPERTFCVVSGVVNDPHFCMAKTPRAAAIQAMNAKGFADCNHVEVFELGRGKRYVRQATAVPAGKAV